MFSGISITNKKLYLLYNSISGHYNVILANLKNAMAMKYICHKCGTLYDKTQKCN